jgi:hypothetical protein
MKEQWEPSDSDLAWCRDLLSIIKDGGVWGCDAGIYRMDHADKKMTRVAKGSNEKMHEMNVVAFGKIGYEVKDA